MNSPTALNLEAIDKAIRQHNANCGAPLTAIAMNPFEVDRLGWDELLGIPIIADDKIGTGRFRLICSGQHGEKEPEAVEAVAEDRLVTA